MLFVVIDKEGHEKALLVKADSRDEVKRRLLLKESQEIVGSFTSAEASALDSASFAVISG